MANPVVTYSDADKVNIYGFCGDDPNPILVDVVRVYRVEARIAALSRQMSPAWHLVAAYKVTPCKTTGFKQKRTYGTR